MFPEHQDEAVRPDGGMTSPRTRHFCDAILKEVVVRGGERSRVLRRFSSSIPRTFSFDVEPLSGPGHVSGTVEVAGSRWLFSKPTVVLELRRTMTVEKGFWDTLFSIYVEPDQDVRVVFH